MKKSVKALLCAALLAAGGGNFCMALGSGGCSESELEMSSLEALATGECSSAGARTWGSSQEFIKRDAYGHVTSDICVYTCDKPSGSSNCWYGQQCYKRIVDDGIPSGVTIGINPCN